MNTTRFRETVTLFAAVAALAFCVTSTAQEEYLAVITDTNATPTQILNAYIGLGNSQLAAKEYAKAREAFDKALALPDVPAATHFDIMNKRAQSYEREGDLAAARDEYGRIRTAEGVDKYWNLRAGSAAARTLINEGRFGESRTAYNELFAIPELGADDRKNIYMGIGYAYERERRWPEARVEYEKALALSGLSEAGRLNALCSIAGTYGGEKDLEAMKKTIEELLPISQGPQVWKLGRLSGLGRLALKLGQPDYAVFAFGKVLELFGTDDRTRVEAELRLVDATLMQKDLAAMHSTLSVVAGDEKIAAKDRFRARALLAGLAAIDGGPDGLAKTVDAAASDLAPLGLSAADRLDGLSAAAGAFNGLEKEEICRAFLKLADDLLVKPPQKTIVCRYMKTPPLGAGGWELSGLMKDPAYRESRFDDYNRADAAILVTDVTADRAAGEDSKKAVYFDNTAFSMVYDETGWHIFVQCGEPNTADILADGAGAGALEMYFTPGSAAETYYQWIINLPGGDFDLYDWNSPYRGFRSLRGMFKSETVATEEGWGTYIFIPWEALYDKLPLDGTPWRFGIIRWTPAGGITWGGKVHEVGRWGRVDWQKPSPADELAIRVHVIRRAWGKYKQTRAEQTALWSDEELGDPLFYKESLVPAITALDTYGEKLDHPDALTADDARTLFTSAVPDWMEFDYKVAELRRQYLEQRLLDVAD